MAVIEDIKALIADKVGESALLGEKENAEPPCLQVSPEALQAVCRCLKEEEQAYFDHLACIAGVDNGEADGTMEVVYHLYSIPYNTSLGLQVVISRGKPVVASISGIWGAANWHEREAYDLMGISFEGHPDLRRILLPADWEGHPLRKDYEAVGKYHGLPLGYEDARDKD